MLLSPSKRGIYSTFIHPSKWGQFRSRINRSLLSPNDSLYKFAMGKIRTYRSFLLSAILLTLVNSGSLSARPHYAARQKVTCSMCHVSPVGSGPRTIFGKVYGGRSLLFPKTSQTDLYYGDFYGMGYFPTKKTVDRTTGPALMSASVSGNLPIFEEEDGTSLRTVVGYDVSPNVNMARDAYLLYNTATETPGIPTHVMVGRFIPPFGLLTDEHRTYTKMQTHNSLRDYEFGADVSGEVGPTVHYDLALTNGFQSGGTFQSGMKYAAIANLRWNPSALPFLVGSSFSFHDQRSGDNLSAWATSLYTAVSFFTLTEDKLPLYILGEAVFANGWNQRTINPNMAGFFVPASIADAFLAQVSESTSLGIYAHAYYELTNRLTLFYKFDRLTLDTDFQGDSFMRHGMGLQFWLIGNIILQARYEKALVGQDNIKSSGAKADQDTVIALARFWF
jgi:hypothetical protein